MRRNHQLSQPPRKIMPKIVGSQDARRVKMSRKNENSQSPVPRQTHTNKQNVHPNVMVHTNSTNKLLKTQKSSSEHMQSTVVKGRKEDHREHYYQIKEKQYNNRLTRNNIQEEKNIQNLLQHKQYFSMDKPSDNLGLPIQYPQHNPIPSSPNPHQNPLNLKRNQNMANIPFKEIKLKINNRSLQKCQLFHQKETPKAVYLVHSNNSDIFTSKSAYKDESLAKNKNFVDFLCCEDCGENYTNKFRLKNFGETPLNNQGLTTRQYFRKLHEKNDLLNTCLENIKLCAKKFQQKSSIQLKKITNYYNNILQVIQISMKSAQDIIIKQRNLGQQILRTKFDKIQEQSEKVKEEMKKIISFQQRGFRSDELIKYKFKADQNFHIMDIELSKIELPIFQALVNWDEQLLKFSKQFDLNFSIKLLSSSDLPQQQPEKQQKDEKYEEEVQNYTSYYNSNGGIKSDGGFSRKAVVDPNDIDLFCDEEMGDNPDKNSNFSFQQKSAYDHLPPDDCIIQLTQEQDIISPAFKAI